VARGPDAWAGDRDAAALDACDELCRDKRVSAATWAEVRATMSAVVKPATWLAPS